jgi:hypothetical protein
MPPLQRPLTPINLMADNQLRSDPHGSLGELYDFREIFFPILGEARTTTE